MKSTVIKITVFEKAPPIYWIKERVDDLDWRQSRGIVTFKQTQRLINKAILTILSRSTIQNVKKKKTNLKIMRNVFQGIEYIFSKIRAENFPQLEKEMQIHI